MHKSNIKITPTHSTIVSQKWQADNTVIEVLYVLVNSKISDPRTKAKYPDTLITCKAIKLNIVQYLV